MTEQEIIDGGWIANDGNQPVDSETKVDTLWKEASPEFNTRAGSWCWQTHYITHWRLHKSETQEKSTIEFKGLEHAWDSVGTVDFTELNEGDFAYPKTTYVPPSDASLQSATKHSSLSAVITSFNAMTGKTLVTEDVELLESLMGLFKNYKENK